jgi:fumarate reductase subunit C
MKNKPSAAPSPWPARLDLAQSASGLFLALFMWLHMAFVSSILWGKDAFWTVARFFEGYFVLGRPVPVLVSAFALAILLLIVLHAGLAMRKFPANWRQYRGFWTHMRGLGHGDTSLWLVQVGTGFAMFFLASVHLYAMIAEPEAIDPYGSADLVWSGRTWPLLLLLLLCVEVHGVVGLYRLALKWGWPTFGDPQRTRTVLRRVMWVLILFFIGVGLASLDTFARIGKAHAPHAGELYTPTFQQGPSVQ